MSMASLMTFQRTVWYLSTYIMNLFVARSVLNPQKKKKKKPEIEMF